MLSCLHIENYILLDSLDVQFPEGLIIISGSTGAGKSVILGALGLLGGAKVDAASLRDNSRNCVIEAEFTNVATDSLAQILEENEVEASEDESLIVRRVIAPSGRSRAFINDCPVPVGVLGEIAPELFDIHSQHQNLQLSSRAFCLKVVDAYAGNGVKLCECRENFLRLCAIERQIQECEEKLRKVHLEADYNNAILQALVSADLKEGELDDLEVELSQLSNAEEIKASLYSASEAFEPDSDSNGILSMMKEAIKSLEKITKYCPSLEPLIERLQSAKYEIDDISAEIESLNESLSLNGERLQWIEERLGIIYGLLRKHSVRTVSELIEIRDSLSGNVFSEEELTERLENLREEEISVRSSYQAASASLHKSRTSAATRLSTLIETKLKSLEMASVRFDVHLHECQPTATGCDEAVFMFSAGGSEKLVEASKKASGGELSRIMLAIKSILAEYSKLPTIIFDEIDTGISGSVADKTGSMICSMGERMQVFAITHLPQVAAKGKAHFLVEKTEGPQPLTSMTQIQGEERIQEIARMLSGSRITPEALANARTLLY